MHIDHKAKAGDKMYIDFKGSKLQLTTSEKDIAHEVEVFVAILGLSFSFKEWVNFMTSL